MPPTAQSSPDTGTPPQFGPCNFHHRGEQVGTASVSAPTLDNGGANGFAIWDATALMRKQADAALSHAATAEQAYSPDALWGLADKIQQLAPRSDARQELVGLLETHRPGIEDALQRYSQISEEEIRAYVDQKPPLPGAHPRLLGTSAEQTLRTLNRYFEGSPPTAQRLSEYSDTLQTLSLMMHVVAYTEDRASHSQK